MLPTPLLQHLNDSQCLIWPKLHLCGSECCACLSSAMSHHVAPQHGAYQGPPSQGVVGGLQCLHFSPVIKGINFIVEYHHANVMSEVANALHPCTLLWLDLNLFNFKMFLIHIFLIIIGLSVLSVVKFIQLVNHAIRLLMKGPPWPLWSVGPRLLHMLMDNQISPIFFVDASLCFVSRSFRTVAVQGCSGCVRGLPCIGSRCLSQTMAQFHKCQFGFSQRYSI